MPSSLQLAAGDPALLYAVKRARQLLNRRAMIGAAAGALPLPGLDWLVDAALLSKLLPALSAEFGLTAEQIERLPKHKRDQVEKAVAVVGSLVIGKFITKELMIRLGSTIGARLTAKQAAKYVPLAGQAVSALIGYTAIRYLGEEHIKDCISVVKTAQLQLPAPEPVVTVAPPKRLKG